VCLFSYHRLLLTHSIIVKVAELVISTVSSSWRLETWRQSESLRWEWLSFILSLQVRELATVSIGWLVRVIGKVLVIAVDTNVRTRRVEVHEPSYIINLVIFHHRVLNIVNGSNIPQGWNHRWMVGLESQWMVVLDSCSTTHVNSLLRFKIDADIHCWYCFHSDWLASLLEVNPYLTESFGWKLRLNCDNHCSSTLASTMMSTFNLG
jgi:hypothetical protein